MKMFWTISLISSVLLSFSGFDFSDKATADRWAVFNDGVMGGRSESQVVHSDEALLFTGNLSLENNGGFASVRAPWGDYDLSAFEEVEVECSGFGGSFMCMLEKERRWYLPYYTASFRPNEEVQRFVLPLKDFKENSMGRKNGKTLGDRGYSDIIRIGFIKNDKVEGPFELKLRSIRLR